MECSISGLNSSPCDPCMELANLEILLAKLEKKRSALKREINHTHSPFIRMIPPELIAKISGFASTDFTIMGSLPAPILLSSICSDWRRTVLGTPRLWSSIKIDLPSSKTSNMDHRTLLRLATFIDEWLARSGQLPLNISLCSSGYEAPDPKTVEKFRTIFKILVQYSSRWHSLNVSIPPTLLSHLQPDHLPLLEQLHVNFPFNMRNSQYGLAFPPSPRLKTVGIQAFIHSILPPIPDLGIEWGNVTHMSAESLTIHDCLEFLRLIPQLVHCEFHNITILDNWINSHHDFPILSSLAYLSLSCYQSSPAPFLDKIALPSLETLVLFDVYSMDPLMAFLERSGCSLHTLSLQQLKKADYLTLLLQFLSPSLTNLFISQSPKRSIEEYLSILTKTYTSQRAVGNDFLPHLETFGYSEAFGVASPLTENFDLPPSLPTRYYHKPASTPLRSVYIDLDRVIHQPISQDILSVLQELKKDGILRTDSLDLLLA